ncbi:MULTISPECIES: hypothetical protein [unclassified Legionella]|uniref:hypothetical protein n=1 Tax=unclassified Legionella TaxID=2622702 RepID=UPI001055944A|nr:MULTISPECIES: hypothetical protein [unclassified Legionella]MDI9818310.1 hypothetical protein [Legionella sp. PL877]
MKIFLVSLFVFMFFLPAHAADISEEEIQTQADDQTLCIQQRLPQCINQCQSAGGSNCVQMCEENIKNECRQAGE